MHLNVKNEVEGLAMISSISFLVYKISTRQNNACDDLTAALQQQTLTKIHTKIVLTINHSIFYAHSNLENLFWDSTK